MNVRQETRARCRTRKIRAITMTKSEWELIKLLEVDIKKYCKQPSVRKRFRVRYKFGGEK